VGDIPQIGENLRVFGSGRQVLFRVGVQGAVGHCMVMFLLLLWLGYSLQRGGILTDETTAWLARLVAL
jgi:hypothetical protein